MALDIVGLLGRFQPPVMKIGLVTTAYVALKIILWILHFIKVYLLSPVFKLHTDVTRLGKWAAVTSCTDGIGKAYAEEFASKGIDIVLLSRSKDKLEEVAKEIEDTYGVQTKVVVADFTRGPEIYEKLEQELGEMEIGILVNCIGMSSGGVNYFLDTKNIKRTVPSIINANVLAVTHITRIVLPGMIVRKKGAIINIGSGSAKVPVPLTAVYSASKAYTDFFSRALHLEYECKNIIVQSVLPYYVSLNVNDYTETNVPSAREYVKQALATLGVDNRTHGYYTHTLQGLPYDILPTSMTVYTNFKWMQFFLPNSRR